MLAVFKRLTNNKGKRRLFENFLSLSGLKVFTYILPLVTLPYLVRVLGVEKYGLVVFAQSFIMFFNVLVDYGFNLSATREISINRGDKNKITEIYSSVLTIKMVLLVLSFGVLWSLVVTVDRLAQDAGLYLLTFLMVVGQALFPIWYFQGVERMKYITIVNILSRAAFALAVFVFVRHEDQYILVPLLNGLGVCFGSAYALFLVKTKFGQTFVWQGFDKVSLHFKDSTQFFCPE